VILLSWTLFMWDFRYARDLKLLSHDLQSLGTIDSSWLVLRCSRKLLLHLKTLQQTPHLCRISSVMLSIFWNFISFNLVYLWAIWTDCLCLIFVVWYFN
jgi:hypothetical protein